MKYTSKYVRGWYLDSRGNRRWVDRLLTPDELHDLLLREEAHQAEKPNLGCDQSERRKGDLSIPILC